MSESPLEEELLEKLHGVLRACDGVSDGARILVDLLVVATGAGLVAEEVDLLEALRLDVLQAVGLVPTLGELRNPSASAHVS